MSGRSGISSGEALFCFISFFRVILFSALQFSPLLGDAFHFWCVLVLLMLPPFRVSLSWLFCRFRLLLSSFAGGRRPLVISWGRSRRFALSGKNAEHLLMTVSSERLTSEQLRGRLMGRVMSLGNPLEKDVAFREREWPVRLALRI